MDDSYEYVTKPRGRRLVTFENQEEAKVVRCILRHALLVGEGLAKCGMPSDHFFRLDLIYDRANCKDLAVFHNLLIAKIKQVMELEQIGMLGMVIRKRAGRTAEMEQFGGVLAECGLSFFQVRLGQRLWAQSLHPQIAREIREKQPRILLLADTAFSGIDIYEAALITRRLRIGLNLPEDSEIVAFVIYDYLRGAREKLHMKGVELYSLIDWFFFRDLRLLPDRDTLRPVGCPTPRLQFESAASAACAAFR